jgi:hypothetical protein
MELKFCELCSIEIKNPQNTICFTCFEILMEECFPPEKPEEPEKKKRKRT